MEDIKQKERLRLDPELASLEKSEANVKVLLNKIKKDMALLESHISFLENVEEHRLEDKR